MSDYMHDLEDALDAEIDESRLHRLEREAAQGAHDDAERIRREILADVCSCDHSISSSHFAPGEARRGCIECDCPRSGSIEWPADYESEGA